MKALRLKTHHFHTKLPCQKPMLRQIKCWLQNGPIKKNVVLPLTTLLFENFVSVRTSFKELICCTNNPNTHICTLCKRWSFIWRSFFPVSICKNNYFVKIWWHVMNGCFWKPCLFELNWTISRIPIWWRHWKFIEQRMTYVVKILSFYGDQVFCIPDGGFSVF